jgi:hypothetical protein
VKPVDLVSDAIKDCSRRNGIVLDPFGGSGTTLIAAQKSGRRARLIEYDPLYCDVIIRTGTTHERVGSRAVPASTSIAGGGAVPGKTGLKANPVLRRAVMKLQPITSAGRFSPLGPRGIGMILVIGIRSPQYHQK